MIDSSGLIVVGAVLGFAYKHVAARKNSLRKLLPKSAMQNEFFNKSTNSIQSQTVEGRFTSEAL